jgi:FkbM family methyltransferase
VNEISVIVPRLNSSSIVVEVGANNGQHTDLFARIVKRVIAFEAHPSLTGDHIKAQHPNVDWIQKAVSNVIGKSTFHLSTSDDGSMINSSSLKEISPKSKEWWPDLRFYPTEVETTTLDCEITSECVDLIWMDVQGAELVVLQGATEILKKTKMVSIEFHEGQYEGAPSSQEIRDFLAPYGFVETVISGDRSVFIHE